LPPVSCPYCLPCFDLCHFPCRLETLSPAFESWSYFNSVSTAVLLLFGPCRHCPFYVGFLATNAACGVLKILVGTIVASLLSSLLSSTTSVPVG
jgi:hypothetical protein